MVKYYIVMYLVFHIIANIKFDNSFPMMSQITIFLPNLQKHFS